jgi:hypothetical protein
MRRHLIFTTAVLGLLLAALPASAAAAVTATKIRIGSHRGFVRVVVDFTGGSVRGNDVELAAGNIDGTGRARLEISKAGALTTAPTTTVGGVRVVVSKTAAGLRVRVITARHRIKFLGYRALRSPTRLAIDLYRRNSRVPLLVGGCVKVGSNSMSMPGMVLARGRAGQIFESTFRVQVRRSTGSVAAGRTVTSPPGPWSTVLHHGVTRRQPGLLEAFVLSAKDGALQCLSQRPLTLMP